MLLPRAITLGKLNLTNSTAGLVLIHVVQGLGFTTLFCRNDDVNARVDPDEAQPQGSLMHSEVDMRKACPSNPASEELI